MRQATGVYYISNPALGLWADETRFGDDKMYKDSKHEIGTATLYLCNIDGKKSLVAHGKGAECEQLEGSEATVDGAAVKVCPLNHHNATIIRELFPYTRPVSHAGRDITIGLGDRLGLASAGHIRAARGTGIFPVLAQQSMRELNLTERTYYDVLDAATWAVFQEHYTDGYGADGDHLKTAEEVKYALDCGYTMITLDCSEHINGNAVLTDDLRHAYLGQRFNAGGVDISYTEDELERVVAVYYGAVRHTIDIYHNLIRGHDIDFEMSVDETTFTTTPSAHFFVANELNRSGVFVRSLAPRFCGEFQKGIDYIGDVNEFQREFGVHAKIAEHFGYKLSVHSGSDKFKIFPIVGKLSAYHLKTAGTSWLEAIRVLAEKDPVLFRKILSCALDSLPDAKRYYHTTENTANIPQNIPDDELPLLLDQSDARQVLHITYGNTLGRYKGEIYADLNTFEDTYYAGLQCHIGKHLRSLGIQKS